MSTHKPLVNGAELSADSKHRYSLTRCWTPSERTLVWVMLNPSTADASEDDPTIRRCLGFAKRDGYGSIVVVNLFSLRATNPKELVSDFANSTDDHTDVHIARAIERADNLVLAWGSTVEGHHRMRERAVSLRQQFGIWQPRLVPLCLGRTKSGQPRHPLYRRGDQPFIPYAGQDDSRGQP